MQYNVQSMRDAAESVRLKLFGAKTTSSSGKISGSYMPLLTDEERSSSDTDHEEDEAALKELDFRPKRSHSGRRIALSVALIALLAASTALCVTLGNFSWIYSATPRLSPLTTQRSAGPSHYIPVWHSDPFPGNQLIMELPIAQEDRDALNVTNTFMVMRKAVVEKHWDEGYVMVRLVGTLYDLPFNPDFHLRSSKFWQLRDDFKVETSIPIDPSDPSSERIIGRPDFGSSVEQQYKFPDTLFGGRNATGEHSYQEGKVVPLRLDINFKGQTIATVNFDLRQRLLPYSRFSICMKPFYGETVPKAFVEWREHHRLLGFEAVHFSSRVANTVIAVEKLNELTGGFDSFEHMPRFDTETKATLAPEAEEVPQRNIPDTWSEELFYNDCYITYRQTSEFIGVWDFDEFLAPHPTKPWTSAYVQEYLSSEWPRWDTSSEQPHGHGHLHMPMTWVDTKRFGNLEPEQLTSVDPGLPAEDIADIAALSQTAAKVTERHFQDYSKAIHRTSMIRGSGIHGGWPGVAAIAYPDNFGLLIYHARKEQGWKKEEYIPYPTSESIVRHLRVLVERIRDMKLDAITVPDATRLLRL